ncbi:hypothetical protein GHT06_007917 [Daphnia sinensis]|uniref:Uncharacterized protein n=1 Tax=Daphnia sinensis TaxID=1820382 RepID=A0AAD5Q1J4_9CRUS|nr:hypothetical protein GHT06_007917 [Daphnia sinensis]
MIQLCDFVPCNYFGKKQKLFCANQEMETLQSCTPSQTFRARETVSTLRQTDVITAFRYHTVGHPRLTGMIKR